MKLPNRRNLALRLDRIAAELDHVFEQCDADHKPGAASCKLAIDVAAIEVRKGARALRDGITRSRGAK